MATLNVKIPDEMDADIDAYLGEHPHYLNKSELVRDAIRHLIAGQRLSPGVRAKVQAGREQVALGEDVTTLDEL